MVVTSGQIELPSKFIFMKVGDHAAESWEKILERKRKEYVDAGRIFWGYGGNACHPLSQVQPFAKLVLKEIDNIVLVMEYIRSDADPDVVPATQYSRDGVTWEPIPAGIKVTGSRYALVLDEIQPGDLEVNLTKYEVAVGPSAGKPAEFYLQGRTDKACFVKSREDRKVETPSEKHTRKANFFARLKDPYAVLLR
jgi:hypothetical protein